VSLLAIALGCGACGRLDFNAVGRTGDAGLSGDAGDGGADRPNVVFLTRNTFTSAQVATADKQCGDAATAAGVPGTFVAWVSTTSTAAIDRLAGSRGWVRTDGFPVTDQPADLLAPTGMYNPIIVDERMLTVGAPNGAWTGTDQTGHLSTNGNCGDWMMTTGTTDGGDPVRASAVFTSTGGNYNCSAAMYLYCFEVGHVAVVRAPSKSLPPSVHRAFLSMPVVADNGPGAFDTQCTTDATNAGLPGTYLAAVATSTTSIASRFTADPRPVYRIDGTEIAPDLATFFNSATGQLEAPVNQQADGTYVVAKFTTGSQSPQALGDVTCNDYTSPAMPAWNGASDSVNTTQFWFSQGSASCNSALPVMCLQE
jgi:hypothetical protein